MFSEGEVIDGRYRILSELGSGGMSHVFRAYDEHVEREVALKVLRPHLTEADSERFRREIRALARFNHDGIVPIYDLGQSEHVYFVMELIEGGLFTSLGPYQNDPEVAARFFTAAGTVAEALGYVHHLGMVHRDLTPRNILLTRDGTPKVMDFGLVQLTETSRQLTKTGVTLGTPHYMAPEQATGAHTGAKTDLYAFGAVLYRTVTGFEPFDAENDQAVLYQHVYGDVVPPTDINPHVPSALSALILQLLEKTPEKRPLSGYFVADALRAIARTVLGAASHHPSAGPGRTNAFQGGISATTTLTELWRTTVDDGPQWPSGVTAGGGFLFVGQRSDQLGVLTLAGGALHRSYPLTDEMHQAPTLIKDQLFVNTRDGALQALAWPSGALAWELPHEDVRGFCQLGTGIVYANADGRIVRLGPTGQVIWEAPLQAHVANGPTTGGTFVLQADQTGWVHALNAATGAHIFKVETGVLAASPAVSHETALFQTREGALHAFSLASKESRWSYDLEGESYATPTVWRSFVFAVSWGQVVHAVHLQTGDTIWKFDAGAPVTVSPSVSAGVLYVATEQGDLIVLDARTGNELQRERAANAPIQVSPLPVGELIITAATDGTITAFRAD